MATNLTDMPEHKWDCVLSCALHAPVEKHVQYGVLQCIHKTHATVSTSHDAALHVHFMWSDRPASVKEFVEQCSAFRITVHMSGGVICAYSVWVDVSEFHRQMSVNKYPQGDVYLTSLLASAFPRSHTFAVDRPRVARRIIRGNLNGWNAALPLFAHQCKSCTRMAELENLIDSRKNKIAFNTLCEIGSTGWSLDTVGHAFHDAPRNDFVAFSGGILADAPGSGKTATVLYHIASTMGHVAPSTEVCGHCAYSALATLIIVPINLPAQWLAEARRFCPSVRIVLLTHWTQLRHLSMASLLSADIVLTTLSFLMSSTKYADLLLHTAIKHNAIDAQFDASLSHIRTPAVFNALARRPGIIAPVVELVHWKRIVVDEVHELLQHPKHLAYVGNLSSRVLWGVSATPFVDATTQSMALQLLLGNRIYGHARAAARSPVHPNLVQRAVRRLVVNALPRNLQYPAVRHQTRMICLTPTEQSMLQGVTNTTDCIQSLLLEGVPPRDRAHPPDFVRTVLHASRGDLESTLLRTMTPALVCETTVSSMCAALLPRRAPLACTADRAHLRREVLRNITFVHQSMHQLNAGSTCSICCEMDCDSMLPCGHTYCARCISQHLRVSRHCPHCRATTCIQRAHTVVKSPNSKVCALQDFVRMTEHRPIVVFAQWASVTYALFRRMSHIAPTYLLRGNTLQRQATLFQFQQTAGVLILNIENSFAGIHLPRVRSVVFAHALVGGRQETDALQKQAIARAVRVGNVSECVQVLFFVAKGCAEENAWTLQQTLSGTSVL